MAEEKITKNKTWRNYSTEKINQNDLMSKMHKKFVPV